MKHSNVFNIWTNAEGVYPMKHVTDFFLDVLVIITLAIVAFTPTLVSADGQPKVDVCHMDDTGKFSKITIADPAYDSHIAHGDTDVLTFYRDADADGFGNHADSTNACEAPTGFVNDATDCDDTDPTINPAASEVADGVDNDCDGQVDEDVCPALNLQAAITKQISAAEPRTLTIELVTLTTQPYQPGAVSLGYPDGFALLSLSTTSCTEDDNFRCRHQAVLEATTACNGTGDYELTLQFACVSGVACTLCNTAITIPFSLTTENFCG
jgi:hypothetical protein